MTRTTISYLSILISVLFVSIFVANAIPGGRKKISDVKSNQEIQELGRFSVDEYNRLQKGGDGGLKFSQVVAAESQVVAGTKYYLKIEAVSKSGARKVFDAEVVVKSWVHSKQLLGFKPSPNN